FDVAVIPNFTELLALPVEKIAAWRDHRGQAFLPTDQLRALAQATGLELVPDVLEVSAEELPDSVDDTHEFLRQRITATGCAIDAGAGGRPEGIVLRTPDRSVIAKLRFEDYERALRRRQASKRG